MKKTLLGMFTAIALVTVGCGDNGNNDTPDSGTPDSGVNCEELAFKQPAGTLAMNFSIDATGRPAGYYKDEDLEWKGTFTYDKESRVLTYAADWAGGAGPYAPLYDDGPWTCGGHEPEGAVAGDSIFGITAFFPIPTEEMKWEYGAQVAPDSTRCGDSGGCWIWVGKNGEFVLPANATGPIDVEGMTLAPLGDVDLRITLDSNDLPEGATIGDPVAIKGSYCDWKQTNVGSPVDGVYTFTLSEIDGCLLANAGSSIEFVWVLDADADPLPEYKGLQGVSAASKGPGDADWVTLEVTEAENGNPSFTIPE